MPERVGSTEGLCSAFAAAKGNVVFDEQPDGDPHGECAAEILRLRNEYEHACALVVQMHEAATGRRGEAPWLGVVEDVAAIAAELERERMRLAACGVVALSDTPDSAAKARDMLPEYCSASCDDVARQVDECMQMRGEREELAMMIRTLTSSLKRHWPHAPQPGDLPTRAVDLLRRTGLLGSPLREHSEADDGGTKASASA